MRRTRAGFAILAAWWLFGCNPHTDDVPDGGAAPRVHDPAAAEAMCRDERTCDELWGANTAGCNASITACLDGLTADQRAEWEQVVSSCVASTTTCAERFTCYATAPRC